MKTPVTGLMVASALMLTVTITAVAAPPTDLHCPGGGSGHINIGADGNSIVLPAGTIFCVKAGSGNTGMLVANGVTTLQEYLFQSGIVDGSGTRGRDVSYYVTYDGQATHTPAPSQTPEPTPSSSSATPEPTLPDTAME